MEIPLYILEWSHPSFEPKCIDQLLDWIKLICSKTYYAIHIKEGFYSIIKHKNIIFNKNGLNSN